VAHDHYTWMNASYVLGVRMTDAFARTGRAAGVRTVGVTYGFAPDSLRATPPGARTPPPIGGRHLRPPYVQRLATRRRCQRSSVVGVTKNDRQLGRGKSRLAAVKKT